MVHDSAKTILQNFINDNFNIQIVLSFEVAIACILWHSGLFTFPLDEVQYLC